MYAGPVIFATKSWNTPTLVPLERKHVHLGAWEFRSRITASLAIWLDKEWPIHEVLRSPIWSVMCSISIAQSIQRKCSHIPVSYSLLLVDGQFKLRRVPTWGCWKVLLAWRGKWKVVNFKCKCKCQLLTEIEDKRFNHLHGKSSGNCAYPSKVWQNSVFLLNIKNKNREGYDSSSSSSSNNMQNSNLDFIKPIKQKLHFYLK